MPQPMRRRAARLGAERCAQRDEEGAGPHQEVGADQILDDVEDARMAHQVGEPRQQGMRLGAPLALGLRHRHAGVMDDLEPMRDLPLPESGLDRLLEGGAVGGAAGIVGETWIAQHHRTERPVQHMGEVDDQHAGERAVGSFRASHDVSPRREPATSLTAGAPPGW